MHLGFVNMRTTVAYDHSIKNKIKKKKKKKDSKFDL